MGSLGSRPLGGGKTAMTNKVNHDITGSVVTPIITTANNNNNHNIRKGYMGKCIINPKIVKPLDAHINILNE